MHSDYILARSTSNASTIINDLESQAQLPSTKVASSRTKPLRSFENNSNQLFLILLTTMMVLLIVTSAIAATATFLVEKRLSQMETVMVQLGGMISASKERQIDPVSIIPETGIPAPTIEPSSSSMTLKSVPSVHSVLLPPPPPALPSYSAPALSYSNSQTSAPPPPPPPPSTPTSERPPPKSNSNSAPPPPSTPTSERPPPKSNSNSAPPPPSTSAVPFKVSVDILNTAKNNLKNIDKLSKLL